MLRAHVLVCFVLGAAALGAMPQEPASQQPVFRAGVDIAQLDLSVYDKDHHPVKGLTAADFTLLEDDKARPIVAFSAVDMPNPVASSAAWMRNVAADVTTNDVRDKRLFVIVIDDVHLAMRSDRARELALAIVNRLGPTDLCALIFSGNNAHSENVTNDRSRLLAALDQLPLTSMKPELAAQAGVEALRQASEYLMGVPGRRKALIDITAFNFPMVAAMSPIAAGENVANGSGAAGMAIDAAAAQTRKLFEAAQRANVNVSVINPLEHVIPPLGWEVTWATQITHETGGLFVAGAQGSADASVSGIFEANSDYYVLGYSSANVRDIHRVAVSVDRPGVTVVARDHYYPPDLQAAAKDLKARTAAPLSAAISNVVPIPDVPMRVAVSPFAIPADPSANKKAAATVAIVLDIDQPAPSVATLADIDLQVEAFTTDGKLRSSQRQTAQVSLRAGRPDDVARAEVLSRIDLNPGRYELRLSAHSTRDDKIGSVYADVDIPDFSKAPVALSGVLIEASATPPVAPRDALASLAPIVPTALRVFDRRDHASAFVRVYQGGTSALAAVQLRIALLSSKGAAIVSREESIDAARFRATGRAADEHIALPLDMLEPGDYLLTIQTSLGGTNARRDVRFTVK